MLLSNDGEIIKSEFYVVNEDDALPGRGQEAQSVSKRIVSFKTLLNATEVSATAVWLDVDDKVEAAAPYLPRLEVIALNFPTFNDGRGYSSANILRSRYAFAGEIRAIGDVRVDQLEQMLRCGFDTFELADGQVIELAIRLLKGFPFSYQKTSDRMPLFHQRSAD